MNGKLDNPKGTISEFFLLENMELFDAFEVPFRNNFHKIRWSLK